MDVLTREQPYAEISLFVVTIAPTFKEKLFQRRAGGQVLYLIACLKSPSAGRPSS